MMKYKVVSLFSGIVGFDQGFINQGFDVIWANDFDKYAVQTYKKNISENIILGDINELIDEIPEHDILIGGFPCQPFSTLGKQKGFSDERGSLIFTILGILNKHKTPMFVLENVKNFINHDKGKTFKKFINIFKENGYIIEYKVLNSYDFGVPQSRRRVFMFGYKPEFFKEDHKGFVFPEGFKTNIKLQDVLDFDVEEKYFLSKKILPTIMWKGNDNYKLNPKIDQEIAKTLTATMGKMHRASQDNYVTDNRNFNNFNNDLKSNIRKLTPNECRKLQGFGDDWIQVVSDFQAYKQFGNAVTVNVSNELAKALNKFLGENYVKKNNK